MSICLGTLSKACKLSRVLCSASEVPRYLCVCRPPQNPRCTLGDEIQGQIKDGSSWGTRLSPGPCCPQAGVRSPQPGASGGPQTTQPDMPRGGELGWLISAPHLESWLSSHWVAGSEAEGARQPRRAPLPVMVTISRGLTQLLKSPCDRLGAQQCSCDTLVGEAGSSHVGDQAASPGPAEGTSLSSSSDGSQWRWI